MLINLRNALMAGKRLPYDAEVEWLYNSGLTQYINTGIVPTTNTEVSLTFDVVESPTSTKIFGGTDIPNNFDAAYVILRHDSSQAANTYNFRVNHNDAINVSLPVGTHTVTMNEYGTRSLIVDGNNVGTFTGALEVNLPMYLFCRNSNGAAQTQYSMPIKLRSLKIRDDNGTLVRDFIPVRKGTVGYLYDRVTRKLFGNAGTGDFVLGPDVVPVEYIESGRNHIQVIDTGFYANQNTKSLITFEKLGADGWLFGSRNGSSSAATDKFGIFAYQSPDGKISAQVGNTYIEPIISGGLTNRKKTIELSLADGVTVDGETIATFSESQKSQTFTSTYPMALFNLRVSSSGFGAGIYCRVYAYQIFENGLIARNFRPVRVGTDATSWEGAMIDTLTRRIYRNAGTGAFTFGNDLKYPIPAE